MWAYLLSTPKPEFLYHLGEPVVPSKFVFGLKENDSGKKVSLKKVASFGLWEKVCSGKLRFVMLRYNETFEAATETETDNRELEIDRYGDASLREMCQVLEYDKVSYVGLEIEGMLVYFSFLPTGVSKAMKDAFHIDEPLIFQEYFAGAHLSCSVDFPSDEPSFVKKNKRRKSFLLNNTKKDKTKKLSKLGRSFVESSLVSRVRAYCATQFGIESITNQQVRCTIEEVKENKQEEEEEEEEKEKDSARNYEYKEMELIQHQNTGLIPSKNYYSYYHEEKKEDEDFLIDQKLFQGKTKDTKEQEEKAVESSSTATQRAAAEALSLKLREEEQNMVFQRLELQKAQWKLENEKVRQENNKRKTKLRNKLKGRLLNKKRKNHQKA